MRLSNAPLGLLLNFNEPTLKQGIRRRVLTPATQPQPAA
jgi:hypothetical protein